ncbi:MAG: hypothetical protein H7X99_11750 [Saprospiraceae bacterium]|nr:hypothetical protein [Saprospiraceae bacterium]
MKVKLIFLIIFLSIIFSIRVPAQPWMESTYISSEPLNFYKIQREFEAYWKDRVIEKGKGWKQFKRWENYWEDRVNEDGSFPHSGIILAEYNMYKREKKGGKRSIQANWVNLGPSFSSGGYSGLGRLNCIGFHPSNENIVYAGAAGGGLWKTVDGGATWTTSTDNLAVLGVSGIVIHPTNPDIMYIATGDGDAGDNYSVGVLKSTDGGNTFNTTGLNWSVTNTRRIRRLIIDPDDHNTLLVASSIGIYRTTNSGTTWTLEETGNFYDIEANPDGATQTFYASTGGIVYKSTNNGDTWSNAFTISGSSRLSLAVSLANNNYLYVLSSKSSNSGYNGVYRSTDSGLNFTLRSSTPNIMGWSTTGSDSGGQGWYDLVITADPNNAETIFVGGINNWKSTDGGITWALKSHWYGGGGVQSVHADKHAMEWFNGSLWEANDGGLYKTINGGNTWVHKSNTMVISQMYRLGVSQTDSKVIAGLQDNGTKLLNTNNNWSDVLGGDGMECIINPTNSNVMYGEMYYGNINRSTNGGSSWSNISNNIPGDPQGAWVTPYMLDPNDASIIYVAYDSLYKSTDQGSSWIKIGSTIQIDSSIKTLLALAPSNSSYIYTGTSNKLYRTQNGGSSWTTLTVPGSNTSAIAIHPENPDILWAVRKGYSDGSKVYKSINGGLSWTNISGTLPNLSANCILYQTGTDDGLYVGMDSGVFYRDNTMSDWEYFFDGLPNVEITELDINYSNNFIYASTYGRGIWKTELIGYMPSCFTPVSLNASDIKTNSVTLNWNNPLIVPTAYEWATTFVPLPPSTGTVVNGTSIIITSLSSATFYYFHVRSACDESAFSSWVTIGPIKTLLGCNDNFYDSGDVSGNYSDNENVIVTLCPAVVTQAIKLNFTSFDVEYEWDALYVFDGPDISSPMIPSSNPATQSGFPAGGYYDSFSPVIVTASYETGCLTIQFLSDPSVTGTGWSAGLTCVNQCINLVDNLNDHGIGSLRKEIGCAFDDQNIIIDPSIFGQTINLNTGVININKRINIVVPAGNTINIRAMNIGPVFQIPEDKSLMLGNLTIYGGSNIQGSAIINNGDLLLNNVIIYQPAASAGTASTILNNGNGSVNIMGNTQLKIE